MVRLLDQLYTLKYETEMGVDFVHTYFTRCIPNDGVNIYEVYATYAKAKPSTRYYYFGRNIAEAKLRFKTMMPYMNITSIRQIPYGAESEQILTDPLKIPI